METKTVVVVMDKECAERLKAHCKAAGLTQGRQAGFVLDRWVKDNFKDPCKCGGSCADKQ